MAERFYRNPTVFSIHPDETVFMNYSVAQHQHQHQLQLQQQQQQQQQQLCSQQHHLDAVMGQAANASASVGVIGGGGSSIVANHIAAGGEMDYFSNSAYFTSTAATGTTNDINNNNNRSTSSLRYFGNNTNFNKMPPMRLGATTTTATTTNMMAKYSSDAGYLQPAVMMNDSTATATPYHASVLPLQQPTAAAATVGGCHYALSNGNTSCYTRNRYTPYNHNRACAAAANSTNLSAIQAAISTAAMSFNYQQQPAPPQQQFASIYKSGPNAAAAAVASAQQTAAAAAVAYERAVASAVQNTSGELSYAHAVASNLDGSVSSVAGSLASAGDIPKAACNGACEAGSEVSSNSGTSGTVVTSSGFSNSGRPYATVADPNQTVTLQITNLDYTMDEASLRIFLMNQLNPITPVVSLVFEGSSYAKVTVPDLYFAKQVVSFLHRKKVGHKRMLVSYTRDSSLTEINTLRCQVAGLLKDVPYYTLPMYKFRELFQSRFKTSISVLDLYRMQDICSITTDSNEEKFITLQPELINSLENSPLMEGLQHSVPYCTIHFKREHHKGWAEQDIDVLPNVSMTISEIQKIIYPLLKGHPGDIPVASLVHCIEGELSIKIKPNESGVNLEHLVCCVQGIQIQMNNFGIKILGWLELDRSNGGNSSGTSAQDRSIYSKNNSLPDPLYQISREVVELVKMSPKSTMKFNRFIPAYHNHFGKQCRVADYGYTKLIELFEALSTVVQIMGDGENRQITLTHRTQIRRFTSDLLRILRTHGNKSVLLSELPVIFAQTQNRSFDVTDYGVCDIVDILDGLVNSNIVVVTTVSNGKDILISIPKRKQTNSEVEKTCVFAGEMVELFSNAPQYTILFQKFVRSYHYHFAYQCRLSDYGFLKLADLMDAIQGVVQMELANDEDRKIFLSPKVARRVFAEQCEELIRSFSGSSKTQMKLDDVLELHKKKFGYQIQPQTLGVKDIPEAVEQLPYVETFEKEGSTFIICHNDDAIFRTQCYRACKLLLAHGVAVNGVAVGGGVGEDAGKNSASGSASEGSAVTKPDTKCSPPKTEKTKSAYLTLRNFIEQFNKKHTENITENTVKAMKHAIEIVTENKKSIVRTTKFMKFLMNIVRLLEQRSSMLLHEIRNALDCGISTCFEFGYPNLFTVLAAYPDIFSVNLAVVRERSEVSLLPTTELRLSAFLNHQHLFGSLKLPSLKQKPTRSSRNPLSDYNNRASNQQQGPPAKTRAISNDISFPGSNNNYKNSYISNNNFYNHQAINKQLYAAQQQLQQQCSLKAMPANYNNNHNNNNSLNNSINSSTYSTASHQSSSLLNSSASSLGCNKENSFNSSLNMFNNSFNSSSANSSFNELNSSIGNMVPPAPAGGGGGSYSVKLWDRRTTNASYYQGQSIMNAPGGLPPLIMPPPPAAGVAAAHQLSMAAVPAPPPPLPNGAEKTSLYELVSNMQMCPMYEPPKPDTPPSDNIPFWIDPIWANTNGAKPANNNDILNIKLPEFKSFNVLPMLLSPYTLSKTENLKQQVFNFENHDRNIA